MKVLDNENKFQPVALMLESRDELLLVTRLLGSTSMSVRQAITGNYDYTGGVAYEELKQKCRDYGISVTTGGIDISIDY